MTFARIRGGGFAANTKLASTEMTALDIDHANSLDKTAAGDTLAGVVQFSGNAQINANTNGGAGNSFSGAINATVTSAIQSNAAQAIQSNVVSGIAPAVASGITASVAGGIDGNATSGIRASVVSGITTNIAGGISGGVAGGIQSGVDGGIRLSGTAADYPTFASPRTRVVRYSPSQLGIFLTTGWTIGTPGGALPVLVGPATSQAIYLPVAAPINGSTITTLTMYIAVGATHAGVPGTLPAIRLLRSTLAGPLVGIPMDAAGSQQFTPAPANGTAWLNAASVQSWTYTATTLNVVDTTQYSYWVQLVDENGANALSSNQYGAFSVNYTNLIDMRPA